MLSEFVEKIRALAVGAEAPKVVPVPGQLRKAFLQHGAELKEIEYDAPLRGATLDGVQSFADLLSDTNVAAAPEVYFTTRGSTAFLDRGDRRETVAIAFARSKRWDALASLAGGRSFAVKEALRFLRYELGGPAAERIYDALRKVEFTRRAAAVVETDPKKRESFGRSVESVVQGLEEVPDAFDLAVAPLATLGLEDLECTVRVGVGVDFEASSIVLQLFPDALAIAERTLLRKLGEAMGELLPKVPRFVGSPTAAGVGGAPGAKA